MLAWESSNEKKWSIGIEVIRRKKRVLASSWMVVVKVKR
jgi:hypothetical protein